MKKFLINTGIFITSFSFFAVTAHAQGVPDVNNGITTLAGLIDAFTKNIVKSLGTLFLALGVVAFFYGVVQYIWGVRQGEAAKITAGNKYMAVGLLALFVMFSVYGIIKLGQGILFGNTNVNKIDIPEFNFVKGSATNNTNNTNGNVLNQGGGAGVMMTCPNGVDKVPISQGVGACPGGTSSGGSNGGVNGIDGYTCPDGKTKYYNQSDAKFCPDTSTSGGAGSGGSDTGGGAGSMTTYCAQKTSASDCSYASCTWNENEDKCYP